VKNRILHIDDAPMILTIVASALARDPSLESKACLLGEEGVRIAADWQPDLILSDVSMPDLNGFEVLGRLREAERTAHIPVVFTTGRGQPEHVADYVARGAAGVIVKPFRLRELAQCVREYLDAADADFDAALPPDVGIGQRLKDDAELLRSLRPSLAAGAPSPTMSHVVHKLAGVAGVYGFASISEAAADIERRLGSIGADTTAPLGALARFDELLELLDREI